jgi:hypothetical protein
MSKIKDTDSTTGAEEVASDQDRRKFIKASLGAAAIGGMAVMGGRGASAQELKLPEMPTKDWRTLNPGPYDTSMYAETTGIPTEGETTWWEGRNMGGVAIGIVRFQANLPMIPGNMGNATTFKFPVVFVEGNYKNAAEIIAAEPAEDFTRATIEACKWLELQGVRAITTNCGFYATYQQVVQEQIDTPFYSSSLVQLPLMVNSTPRNKKVGVLTANGGLLKDGPTLRYAGLSDEQISRLEIEGLESDEAFNEVLGLSGALDPRVVEKALLDGVKRLVKREPNLSSILLECTELAPSGRAVQEMVKLPVWDFTTLANWMYSGAVRRDFVGHI